MGASVFGSIFPAVWSFQLALRSRGLGSALTTLHLFREQEAAKLLGIPENVMQVALLPVAYTKGTDFKITRAARPRRRSRRSTAGAPDPMGTIAVHAERDPNRVAVIYGNGDVVETWGELEQRSRRWGHLLRARGLGAAAAASRRSSRTTIRSSWICSGRATGSASTSRR